MTIKFCLILTACFECIDPMTKSLLQNRNNDKEDRTVVKPAVVNPYLVKPAYLDEEGVTTCRWAGTQNWLHHLITAAQTG